MNYQLSILSIGQTRKNIGKKPKNRYFEFTLRRKRRVVRATVFEATACQTPRCRNIIYDGVRLEISPYNLRAVTTLRVPPKERNEPKMRKQTPRNRARRFRRLHVRQLQANLSLLPKKTAWRLSTLGNRARVRSDGFFNEHGYCAPIIRE